MTTYLLDANVLIALTVAEHEHHGRASAWIAGIDEFAVCPLVEGALVRFLVRIGERASVAQEVPRTVHAVPGCTVWPDSLSYVSADLARLPGHRQVADAYLVSVASDHGDSVPATLDEALVQAHPQRAVLVPKLK